jgi:hypothetical protein
MTYAVEDIARVCHEANRALQQIQGDPAPSAPWDAAEQWQREAAVDGVAKSLAGTTAERLHQDWCDLKVADGWVYGPVKDGKAKTHPCLVPYDELDKGQQDKDHVFAAIVQALS